MFLDQYNGFVTLKYFKLPDDGFDWGAETCWSDCSVINYPELTCAFRWFIFVFIIENARSKKKVISYRCLCNNSVINFIVTGCLLAIFATE